MTLTNNPREKGKLLQIAKFKLTLIEVAIPAKTNRLGTCAKGSFTFMEEKKTQSSHLTNVLMLLKSKEEESMIS